MLSLPPVGSVFCCLLRPGERRPQTIARFTVETIFLGGRPFVYSDEDWSQFPDVAMDAYHETRERFSLYWWHLFSGTPIIEDGEAMAGHLLMYRCMELANGLARLRQITRHWFEQPVH